MTVPKYYKEDRLYHCSECNKDHYYWSKIGKDHEEYCDVIYVDGLISVGYKCNKCGKYFKRTDEFFKKDSRSLDGLRFRCKLCEFYDNIEYRYGLTEEEYKDIYNKQDKKCDLCDKELKLRGMNTKPTIQVDHDHKTGRVRGMLCMNCNVNLGWYLKRKDKVNEYARKK